MTREKTLALLAQILAEIAPEASLADVKGDDDLRESIDLDSIDFQNLVIALHDRTGAPIPEADYPRLLTMDGMVAYFAEVPG
ncbi:acyl carrier protein [Neoroseomonas oryzicola]|uniref:Acyl carrier protein n=1 Tax=Neoroseomonas oryzicola TaxID=535904 RepID=A0A9X9WJV2_9PROT|nr:phosphopantetheine-binding protein [Neoroseomonas oryzicola]MBR0660612.1 acyl carrier protein [Neoroseomonas oryzicola]NKE20029.1 acyl carrier protein [Neoroseomonas oryzicola]